MDRSHQRAAVSGRNPPWRYRRAVRAMTDSLAEAAANGYEALRGFEALEA
jgi:hypothetical protein